MHFTRLSPPEPAALDISAAAPFSALLTAVEASFGTSFIRLPETFQERIFCTACGELTEAACPEWKWLLDPRCSDCSGPHRQASDPSRPPASYAAFHTDEASLDVAAGRTCQDIGIVPGSLIDVRRDDGTRGLAQLPGEVEDLLTNAGAAEAACEVERRSPHADGNGNSVRS